DHHRRGAGLLKVDERAHPRALVAAAFLTALSGIVYELLLGTVSSFLLGDTVLEWSLTVGVFLSAMGLGSWLSRFVARELLARLLLVEILLGLVGGLSALALFTVFALEESAFQGA